MTTNPYSAPAGESSGFTPEDAKKMRQQHRYHELACKGIAVVFLVHGVLGVVLGILVPFISSLDTTEDRAMTYATSGLLLLFGLPLTIVAWGLISLRPWSRVPAIGVSMLSLIVFPVGTIVGGWLLTVLLSNKGKAIFSPQYRAIISVT